MQLQTLIYTSSGKMFDGLYRMNILRLALEIVTEDHGGRVTTEVWDADNNPIPCFIGIVASQVPLMVAVQADGSGLVSFVYELRGDNRGLVVRFTKTFTN